MSEKPIGVAVLGLGNVGSEVVRIINESAADLAARIGAQGPGPVPGTPTATPCSRPSLPAGPGSRSPSMNIRTTSP